MCGFTKLGSDLEGSSKSLYFPMCLVWEGKVYKTKPFKRQVVLIWPNIQLKGFACHWPSNAEAVNQHTSSLIGSPEGIVVIILNSLDKIQGMVCLNLEKENNFEIHDKHAMFVQGWEQEKWASVETVETTSIIFCQLSISIVLILTGVMCDVQRSQLKKKCMSF